MFVVMRKLTQTTASTAQVEIAGDTDFLVTLGRERMCLMVHI